MAITDSQHVVKVWAYFWVQSAHFVIIIKVMGPL
jgi:hypothetical protein